MKNFAIVLLVFFPMACVQPKSSTPNPNQSKTAKSGDSSKAENATQPAGNNSSKSPVGNGPDVTDAAEKEAAAIQGLADSLIGTWRRECNGVNSTYEVVFEEKLVKTKARGYASGTNCNEANLLTSVETVATWKIPTSTPAHTEQFKKPAFKIELTYSSVLQTYYSEDDVQGVNLGKLYGPGQWKKGVAKELIDLIPTEGAEVDFPSDRALDFVFFFQNNTEWISFGRFEPRNIRNSLMPVVKKVPAAAATR